MKIKVLVYHVTLVSHSFLVEYIDILGKNTEKTTYSIVT